MKLYKIRNWNALFENNRSRTVTKLSWVSIPNRHDGENFTNIVQNEDGAMIFSGFILMVEVASKCNPRGTLIKADGTPHTPPSLSLKTRAPEKWFASAINFLEKYTDWLEVQELPNTLSGNCQEPVTALSADCNERRERREGKEGKGMEWKEVKGKDGMEAEKISQISDPPTSFSDLMAKAAFQ